jgi:adenylate cyclase
MSPATTDSAFARALAAEILDSERMRARVLALILAVLLIVQLIVFGFWREHVQHIASRPLPPLLPLYVLGPFVVYECLVLFILSRIAARGWQPPWFARFVNATIETSLPTVLLAVINYYMTPDVAFAAWPSLLYFIFILVSTLRLNFVLPMFTSVVAAVEYLGLAAYLLPLAHETLEPVQTPLYHFSRAALMLLAGAVAGTIAIRLRHKFEHAAEEAAARERVTNLFGQHVSPSVVERLLDRAHGEAGEIREVCVMFLDIRDFTAQSRSHRPQEVVEYLNRAFAFMIEAVERHHGIINKFLGDGFMAIFGAPLDDPRAAHNAVAAALEILAEIDRRGLTAGPWPLRVGIGLHVGKAVTGNVGSPRRKEFTVIGDTVNFAARLEQLNKEHGSRLLVSDAVVQAVDGAARPATLLGAVPIKGYAEPIRVWRLDP